MHHFSNTTFSDKLVSGKDVLFFGANSALMIYMGTGTIDDIDVDIWNGCIYNKENDLTMNATYYFTCKKTNLCEHKEKWLLRF